jgi:chromosome segregation ATPase
MSDQLNDTVREALDYHIQRLEVEINRMEDRIRELSGELGEAQEHLKINRHRLAEISTVRFPK